MFDHLAAEPVYNTRAVVQRTGVPADTFRAWERRYGLPRPERSPGNHRLYSDRDIATISWLREQTLSGLTISQSVALFRSAVSIQTGAHSVGRRSDAGDDDISGEYDPLGRYRDELFESLISFDAGRADRILEEVIAIGSVEDLGLYVLQPILAELGDRWAQGNDALGAAHFATAFIARKLGALFNLSMPDVGRGPVLAACLEGELHDLGLLLTSLFISRRGYRVIYLGPNLPLAGLVEAVGRILPRAILLSTSTRQGAQHLADAIEELERQISARCRVPAKNEPHRRLVRPIVAYGGAVYRSHPEFCQSTGGTFLGLSADEAVTRLDQLMMERV